MEAISYAYGRNVPCLPVYHSGASSSTPWMTLNEQRGRSKRGPSLNSLHFRSRNHEATSGPIGSSFRNPPSFVRNPVRRPERPSRFPNRGPKPSRNSRRALLTSRHSISRSGRTGLGIRIFHPQLVVASETGPQQPAIRIERVQRLTIADPKKADEQRKISWRNQRYGCGAIGNSPKNLRLPPISRLNIGVVPNRDFTR